MTLPAVQISSSIAGARQRTLLKGYFLVTIGDLEDRFEDERQGTIINPLMDIDGDLFCREASEAPPISNGVRELIRRKVSRLSHSWL